MISVEVMDKNHNTIGMTYVEDYIGMGTTVYVHGKKYRVLYIDSVEAGNVVTVSVVAERIEEDCK